MTSQINAKNFLKNDFNGNGIIAYSKYYIEALKYYGFNGGNPNKLLYPLPVIKNSRTYTKQASLPRMPVPALDKSINKYLTAVRPLLNENEFENTKKIANNFVQSGGIGEKLQRMLYERASKYDNWLAQWWLDKTYLEPRYGVVINVNPFILHPKVNFNNINEQIAYATNCIHGVIDYKRLIDSQQLPIEKYLDSPLCMDQYYKIIGSCRIPQRNRDLIKLNQPYIYASKHITVMYKNRAFSLQVLDENENALSKEEIFSNLKSLVENTKNYLNHSLGVLTAEHRDNWADVYNKLVKDNQNKKNFDLIHDSLFVLCLDDDLNGENGNLINDERSSAGAQLLHGSKTFSSNRWFDKTLQVIVSANGVCGLNFEHSLAEALPFANLSDHMLDYMRKGDKLINTQSLSNNNLYKELEFNIPTEIKGSIDKAKFDLNKRIDDLDLYILNFTSFGKNFPKSQKMSPDAFVQIAIQLAFYKIHKKWANAYESGSLRKFPLGRTEIIRSCSEATVKFLQSTTNSSLNEKAALLKNAINYHRDYTTSVLNCESFDRHLLGLKLIALENNIDLPDLYNDIAFKRIAYYQLSTSQVSGKNQIVCGYGPAVLDGYGVCYNILEKNLLFGLSTFNACKETSAKSYANSLNETLLEMQAMLINSVNSKL